MSNEIAPKLRNLFFNNPVNSGQGIETEPKQPTDAEIIAVLKAAGLMNLTGVVSPLAPEAAVIPAYVGQVYIDTTGGKLYFSIGVRETDWVEVALAT